MAYNITVGSYQTDTIQNFEQAHEIFVCEIEETVCYSASKILPDVLLDKDLFKEQVRAQVHNVGYAAITVDGVLHSFNALYQAAYQAPGMKNVRYLKM